MINNLLKFTLNIQCGVFQYAEAAGNVWLCAGYSNPLLLSTFFFLLFLVGTLKCVNFCFLTNTFCQWDLSQIYHMLFRCQSLFKLQVRVCFLLHPNYSPGFQDATHKLQWCIGPLRTIPSHELRRVHSENLESEFISRRLVKQDQSEFMVVSPWA